MFILTPDSTTIVQAITFHNKAIGQYIESNTANATRGQTIKHSIYHIKW